MTAARWSARSGLPAPPWLRAALARQASRFGATYGALGELWDYLPTAPSTLRAMVDDAGGRVLVAVRCAEHNVLVAAVLLTPSGRSLLVTANEDKTPWARRHPDPELGTWEPMPTDLDALDQPPIFCPRCDAPRPVPDLAALAATATRATRRDIRC